MSVKATPSNPVFGNQFLNRAVLDFLPLQDQDRCKRTNKLSNEHAKALQRPRILNKMPSDWRWIARKHLENATIINFPLSAIHVSKPLYGETAGIEYIDLPKSFVIGFAGGDVAYAAVRVEGRIPGKWCGCISTSMQRIQKNRVIYNYGKDCRTGRDTQAWELNSLLGGHSIKIWEPSTKAREPSQPCCSLRRSLSRIVSCFRWLCFEPDLHSNTKIKLA